VLPREPVLFSDTAIDHYAWKTPSDIGAEGTMLLSSINSLHQLESSWKNGTASACSQQARLALLDIMTESLPY